MDGRMSENGPENADRPSQSNNALRQAFDAGRKVGWDEAMTSARGISSDPVDTIQSYEDWVAAGSPVVDGSVWVGYPDTVPTQDAYVKLRIARGQE